MSLSKLRELVEKWPHDEAMMSHWDDENNIRVTKRVHVKRCHRCAVEALLPELEQQWQDMQQVYEDQAEGRRVNAELALKFQNQVAELEQRERELMQQLERATELGTCESLDSGHGALHSWFGGCINWKVRAALNPTEPRP